MEMEYLRWILSGLAALLIIAVYLWGRSRNSDVETYIQPTAEKVPHFSATDSDDTEHDDVGPVRVIRRADAEIPAVKLTLNDEPEDNKSEDDKSETASVATPEPSTETDDEVADHDEQDNSDTASLGEDGVIVLYLVAKPGEEIKGEHILSACVANQLEHGEMKIFHRLDDHDQILFSMANMLEPGYFEYETMHEHTTRGVSLFIQLKLCDDPIHALDEMLICAHSIASLLDLTICDHNRQLLNESMAAAIRQKAKHVAESRTDSDTV